MLCGNTIRHIYCKISPRSAPEWSFKFWSKLAISPWILLYPWPLTGLFEVLVLNYVLHGYEWSLNVFGCYPWTRMMPFEANIPLKPQFTYCGENLRQNCETLSLSCKVYIWQRKFTTADLEGFYFPSAECNHFFGSPLVHFWMHFGLTPPKNKCTRYSCTGW